MRSATDYLSEVRERLQNPAVSDPELIVYINAALRDVHADQYSTEDNYSQVVDTALQFLVADNKFPELGSISATGVSTSFAAGDPERYRRRLAARRQAAWMVP